MLLKSFIEDIVFLVSCAMSPMVAPLYFLSRYLPATIIGPPMAHVTPVGSGTHSMMNPIFWSFLPGAGALRSAPRELDADWLSIFAMSV